jgi:hypothetical protein
MESQIFNALIIMFMKMLKFKLEFRKHMIQAQLP